MKNQLDLQESEWEAYEETFNSIAEQLDDARGEVDELTAERNALLAQQSEWSSREATLHSLQQACLSVLALALCFDLTFSS